MTESILDRLLDLRAGVPGSRAPGTFDFAEAMRRDLESLLNTRNHLGTALAQDWPEAAASVLGYGLADADDCLLSNSDEIEELRSKVLRAIEVHEPRLHDVEVKVIAAPRPMTHEVVLEIRGVVKLTTEEVVWSSTLHGGVVIVRRTR